MMKTTYIYTYKSKAYTKEEMKAYLEETFNCSGLTKNNILKRIWSHVAKIFKNNTQIAEIITEIEVDLEDQVQVQKIYKELL